MTEAQTALSRRLVTSEDGGDPWMSFCADRIKSGEHRREEGA